MRSPMPWILAVAAASVAAVSVAEQQASAEERAASWPPGSTYAASKDLATVFASWSLAARTACTVLALFGLGYVYLLALFAMRLWRLKAFPGPTPVPIVGNLLDPALVRSLICYLSKMRKNFGKMVVIWPGNSPLLVVMHPMNVRQILSDTRRFPKGVQYTEVFARLFGDGLVTSSYDKHKKDRACLGKYFVRGNLQSRMRHVADYTKDAMDLFLAPNVGQEVNIDEMFALLTIRCFCRIAFSRDMWEDMDVVRHFSRTVSFGSHTMGEHMVYGHPVWRIIPKTRKMLDTVNECKDVVQGYVTDRRALMRDHPDDVPDDALHGLLAELGASDADAVDHLFSMLAAGQDTTAFFCCYVSYMLARHPEVQDKLKAEIADVLEGRTELTSDDFDDLKYMSMVFHETLRLFTVIPFVMRSTEEDTVMKATGDVIPKGTSLLLPLSHMNRDPDVWDKPTEFVPERFERIQGSSAKLGFLPFGYGTRACIGNVLAMMEAKTIMAQMLQHYRFREAPGFRLRITAGVSLTAQGVHVGIERDTTITL